MHCTLYQAPGVFVKSLLSSSDYPFLWPAWPLNIRVGANSPSLWPTMGSVMKTGIKFLPLCTAIVSPTISGTIIEARDQVLITCLRLLCFAVSTFLINL